MGKRYIKDKQIHTGVLDIVSQMYAEDWRPDYIVGVTRGGLYPAVLMSHYTGIKMHTLDVCTALCMVCHPSIMFLCIPVT